MIDIETEKNHDLQQSYGTALRTGKRVKAQTCVFLVCAAFIPTPTLTMPHRTPLTPRTPTAPLPTTETPNTTALGAPAPAPAPKRENLLVNLVCNIALPSLILAKLSAPERLGPALALVAALLFPLGYGLWDFAQRRSANFVSVIGLASVLLTGGLGLMQVDGLWFAVKEAAIPALIAACVWASQHSRRPLVRQFVYNEQVIDVARIDAALDAQPGSDNSQPAAQARFERLLRQTGQWLVGSFLFSAVLNFALARWLLQSPSGSPEFNAELAKMNLISWPVITLPSMAIMLAGLWRLLRGITQLTGLPLEAIFHARK
ncbi:VC0807 family protein [Cephaloticoccus capnophilus]|uniref:VC0807 family protein n=1 Tax=Cephaloticoccus capnophilus TaxID=1548208 RepID=UPI001E4C6ECE|nr:VC0807 family protein [Cephaloticoccus capnophilus]